VTAPLLDPSAAVVAAARRMNTAGVNRGTAGNVSTRAPDGMLITPSGARYDRLEPANIVAMGLDGTVRSPAGAHPSIEWRLHAAVYAARADVGAIVHAHPRYATALASVRRGIPAFHYMVAMAGGEDIRCSAYATPGSVDLGSATVAALDGRRACLLANHGLVACGAGPDQALDLAIEVEALAAQYVTALHVGEPAVLSHEEMLRILAVFETYPRRR
jgi:L-fuculose-phosphate aldolase